MSFGMVASSYVEAMSSVLLQQNFGVWTGTTMSVTLPSSTSPSSIVALFVAGNTTVPTPGGWTLRESQVNAMGHYLFTVPGGANSWSITTDAGLGTWYVAEIDGGTYDMSASANETSGAFPYTTPVLTPSAGNRLLLASVASLNVFNSRTVDSWTDGFTEVADMCNEAADNPVQGVAERVVVADGIAGYQTTATFSDASSGRSAIIASFTL